MTPAHSPRPITGSIPVARNGVPAPRPDLGELKDLEAHWSLGLLIEAVREYAIFSLGPTGDVRTWNLGAHRIKGYTEQEILGRHFSVFYRPEDRRANLPDAELAHATQHGQWTGEGWRVRKDGTRFWANVVITAVPGPAGELDGFVKVTRDESDRKAVEAADRQLALNAERDRIAVTLSDTIVRSIFSATLSLECALSIASDPRVTARINEAVSTLDATLSQIRTAVNGLVQDRVTALGADTRPPP
jgi:PAS domain S-box-containing protein